MAKRQYTIEEKAAVVAAAHSLGNISEAARLAGVSRFAVHDWQRQQSPEFQRALTAKKAELGAGCVDLAARLLSRFSELVDTATLNDKSSTLFGILVDKAQLLTGQPTAITESRSTEADLRRLADDALARYIAAGLSREAAEERLKRLIPEAARVLAAAPASAEAEAIEAELVTETEPAGSDKA